MIVGFPLVIWKYSPPDFRVYAVADGSDSEAPVLVVVRHEKGVLSWQVGSLSKNRLA